MTEICDTVPDPLIPRWNRRGRLACVCEREEERDSERQKGTDLLDMKPMPRRSSCSAFLGSVALIFSSCFLRYRLMSW